MTLEIWIALAAANFAACLAPGQNAALITAAAARSSAVGGGVAMIGILVAELTWALIAIYLTFGARELAGDAFILIQILSAALLVWFGITTIRSCAGRQKASACSGASRLLRDGVFVGLANPLALVFFLSVFPAFVPDGTTGFGSAIFFISAIMISSAAGLAPYLAAGDVIGRAGKGLVLQFLSGGALAGTGLLLLARIAV
ncbi:LysE family translocator [Cribrihabitans sp. XS_ASV171]